MDDIFKSYIIPAVITGVVALISMIITSMVTYQTTKAMIKGENDRLKENISSIKENERIRLSAEYISSERIKWIQKIRESVAKFKAHALVIATKFYAGEGTSAEDQFNLSFEQSLIELLLNYKGERDKKIKNILFDAVKAVNEVEKGDKNTLENFNNCCFKLADEVSAYLKIEWERVKKDVVLETWTEEDEKKIILEK